jgi:hypothetical protein
MYRDSPAAADAKKLIEEIKELSDSPVCATLRGL